MKGAARAFRWLTLAALVAAAILMWRAPPPPAPLTGSVDRIVVEKGARRLTLWQGGRAVRSYAVALGFAPAGDKVRQGDGRTPEGVFRIDRRNDRSAYHLSLGLDYPQAEDRARARAGGYDPGGDIMIHGQPNALPAGARLPGDWTAGCIALTDAEMAEVWAVTPLGTPVEVRP
jgi:murein L,D-transpeptidase YafK